MRLLAGYTTEFKLTLRAGSLLGFAEILELVDWNRIWQGIPTGPAVSLWRPVLDRVRCSSWGKPILR